ncbi:hypothetical protein [Sporosarcina sp. FSL K6-1508]|uniref:hypothetical protein n=1 Tax=Sporosarcina sp. FSL K6-1508 TaxID=2921553 RepID=UPI0030F9F271
MKKINFPIIFVLIVLLYLFVTFFLQYEYLFVTRMVLVIFTIVFFVIEIKKEYFLANKMIFIIFSVVSIIALIVSVLFDNTSANSLTNNRAFLIPVYVFVLIVIMYKDLYDKNK